MVKHGPFYRDAALWGQIRFPQAVTGETSKPPAAFADPKSKKWEAISALVENSPEVKNQIPVHPQRQQQKAQRYPGKHIHFVAHLF
jgi:hypothetical protein